MDDEWTPESAEAMARALGISLGEKQWCVITSSRELIARKGRVPVAAEIAAACGMTAADVKALFPGDALARLAGAPELERRR